jgi:agmatine deiminase
MAFPPATGCGLSDSRLVEARRAWSAVAHAILEFEPVSMLVDPADARSAERYLSSDIDRYSVPLDDAWMRDIGPTFVVSDAGGLGAVNWRFNGWGQQAWAHWDNDQHVAARVAALSGATRLDSELVNEGGAMQVDGRGAVVLTETVQLDPGRNPGATHAEIEAELARTLGAHHAIWLQRGLARDYEELGTRGHADILVAIPEPGVILVHDQRNPAHPDYEVTREILATLAASTNADGGDWTVRRIPAPRTLRDATGFVDYSYINHLVVNNAVIACTFNDPADDTALGLLAEAYPERKVQGVDARPIFANGGGIHCITQQQPLVGG